MRTDIDHLPASKRRELERVVQILFEEFGDATLLSTGKRKAGRILKIILFGSYARGGWVDEPYTAKGYQSDFDLLVIVNQKELTDTSEFWYKAEDRLMRERMMAGTIKTPVNFIVHTRQEVNDGLAHGRYFFMDIARDGIALYQLDDGELHVPKPKTPTQALATAAEYFEEWLTAANDRLEIAKFSTDRGRRKAAAFDLHQATEFLYHCVLLVCTFYTPHVHNLEFLRKQAERLDSRLFDAWPRDLQRDRAKFSKLKDAYVKARYSKHYCITAAELAWLSERVNVLGGLVHDVCEERLTLLRQEAAS